MKARLNSASLCVTITLLSALVGGCGDNTSNTNVQPSPQPVASPAFPKPTVPDAVKSPAKIALTRPTNPDDRLRVIKSGRLDPFNALASSTTGILSTTSLQSGSKQLVLKQASLANSLQGSTVSENNSNQCGSSEGATASRVINGRTSLVSLPTLPAKIPPNEARGTFVSGIATIGATSYAIIKAPSENQTRWIPQGGTLADGSVRIKAINAYQEGSVDLEQNGETISRRVGAPSLQPEASTPEVKGGTVDNSTPGFVISGKPGASGTIKGLVLKRVRLTTEQSPLIAGSICNGQGQSIKVKSITLQLEDKNGVVLNTLPVNFSAPYSLAPGKTGEFDERLKNTELGLRGRSKEEVTIKLVDWS